MEKEMIESVKFVVNKIEALLSDNDMTKVKNKFICAYSMRDLVSAISSLLSYNEKKFTDEEKDKVEKMLLNIDDENWKEYKSLFLIFLALNVV